MDRLKEWWLGFQQRWHYRYRRTLYHALAEIRLFFRFLYWMTCGAVCFVYIGWFLDTAMDSAADMGLIFLFVGFFLTIKAIRVGFTCFANAWEALLLG